MEDSRDESVKTGDFLESRALDSARLMEGTERRGRRGTWWLRS